MSFMKAGSSQVASASFSVAFAQDAGTSTLTNEFIPASTAW